MPVLYEIALLMADTVRSKAYLQLLVEANLIPGQILLYTAQPDKLSQINTETSFTCFRGTEPLIQTLQEHNLSYTLLETDDANSNLVCDAVAALRQDTVIYSGYGGTILSARLLSQGKRFLHIHAGRLPDYRGSTTAYYSLLNEHTISATAIFLSEKIDEGQVILGETFPPPASEVNLDYDYEPYLRARVLVKALRQYATTGFFETTEQEKGDFAPYYVIHPLLKHIALLNNEGCLPLSADAFSQSEQNEVC